MKHIRALKTKWQIRFTDAARVPAEVSFGFEKSLYSKRQIEKLRDELYVERDRGWDPWSGVLPWEQSSPQAQQPLTVLGAVTKYCEHKRTLGRRRQRGGWNAPTYRNYLVNLKAFARMVGTSRLVSTLTTEDLSQFIFQEGLVEETHAMYRRQLATFVRYLEEEGHVEGLKLPRALVTRRKIEPYLTEDELEAVCRRHEARCRARTAKKHAPKTGPNTGLARLWMSDAFRIAFYQGLRRGELLALRRGAVDLGKRRMRIGDTAFVPKGRDENVVTITLPALPLLEKCCAGKGAEERLFSFNSPGRLSAAFRVAAAEAVPYKPGLHFHSLRRSSGYYWAERGLSPWDVKDLLRHKSIRTTEGFYVQRMLRGQAQRLDQAYQAEAAAGRERSSDSGGDGAATHLVKSW